MRSSFTCNNCGKELYSLIEIFRDGDNIYCEACAYKPNRRTNGSGDDESPTINEASTVSQKIILIVEDDSHTNKLLCELINEEFGENVKTVPFYDGKPAFEFLKGNADRVNLIISCLIMPELSGMQLLKMSKELNPRIPFIIHSALDPRGEDMISSADAYIVKQSDLSELLNAIRKFLNI